MKKTDKSEKRSIVIVSAFMGLITGIVISVITSRNPNANTPEFKTFCITNMLQALLIGLFVVEIIPFVKIIRWVEKKTGNLFPSYRHLLVFSIFLSLINVAIVGAAVCLVNIIMARAQIPAGQAPPFILMWGTTFLPIIIPAVLICYIVAIALIPVFYGLLSGNRNKES